MAGKRNRKRDRVGNNEKNEQHKHKHNEASKQDTQKGSKQDAKKEEVLLMGAPQSTQSEKLTDGKKEEKKQIPTDTVDRAETDRDEKRAIEITRNNTEQSGVRHMNLGRLFLGLSVLLIAYLGIGSTAGWFGSVDISFLALWPLVLIFLGFSLFKVKTPSGKVLGAFIVVIATLLSFGLIFRNESVVTLVLSGETRTEIYEVESFSNVSFAGVGSIKVIAGDEASVSIEADEAVLESVSVVSLDGDLVIAYDNLLWSLLLPDAATMDVVITAPAYETLSLAGTGSMTGSGIESEHLLIDIQGVGEVSLADIAVLDLRTRVTGEGGITLSGSTTRQVVRISGQGRYDATDLSSSEAGVRIAGDGDVFLLVTDILDVSITGSGNVTYLGEPEVREGAIAGAATVQAATSTQQ